MLIGSAPTENPIRYIRPHPFDWGIFKAYGILILLGTGASYLACFIVSLRLIRRMGRQLGFPGVTLAVGLICLAPMMYMALQSLFLQLSSAHYQERTHIPAVIAIALSFGTLVIASLIVEMRDRHRRARGSVSRARNTQSPEPQRGGIA